MEKTIAKRSVMNAPGISKDGSVKQFSLVDFTVHSNEVGSLVALEQLTDAVPFEIKRVYYIYGVKSQFRRGMHAHKKLKQLIFCISGSCDLLLDDGTNRETITLSNPASGVYIFGPTWREMSNFSDDCALVVLASEVFDTDDYLYEYDDFIRHISQ